MAEFEIVERRTRMAVPHALPDPVEFAKDHEYGSRVKLSDGKIFALRRPTWQIVPEAKKSNGTGEAPATAPVTDTANAPAQTRK